jgi:hypothetical protein
MLVIHQDDWEQSNHLPTLGKHLEKKMSCYS